MSSLYHATGRIGDFSLGQFNATLDCFSGRTIGTLGQRDAWKSRRQVYWERDSEACGEISMSSPQKWAFPWGDLDPV